MSKPSAEQEWSKSEFQKIDIGDTRLNERFQKIAAELAATPGGPINQASEDSAATKAAYRFFQNERATIKTIFGPHQERTVERIKGEPLVIAIQDTTYVNYTNHKKTSGLGPIGDSRSDSQGLAVHSTLAVTTQGLPLGLLGQKIWAREGYNQQSARERKNTPIEQKESYRWIEGLEHTSDLTPHGTRVITVCDRECDIYEFFVVAQRCNAEFVVRASWDRHLENSEFSCLWKHLEAESVAGNYEIVVLPTDKRKGRTCTLEVRFATVTLGPTQRHKSSSFYPLSPVPLYAVYAVEINPPAGEEKVEWMLLSNVPVSSFAEAIEKIDWYKCRWLIETFHKVLKSGCTVEECRLQTEKRLSRYITLMSIVAWRIFWMTHLKRTNPKAPATTILTLNELRTLIAIDTGDANPTSLELTVAQTVVAIAKLGGFLARKHDKNPGNTSIWRGWSRLQDAALLGSVVFAKRCG